MGSELRIPVTYIDGDRNLGRKPIKVQLILYTNNLTVEDKKGKALIAIPWPNLRGTRNGSREKEGAAGFFSQLFAVIPLLDTDPITDSRVLGFSLTYAEPRTQTTQSPFFATGMNPERRDVIQHHIWVCRDKFMGDLNDSSQVRRR